MKNGKSGFRLPDKKVLIGAISMIGLVSYFINFEKYQTQVKLDSQATELWEEGKFNEAAAAFTKAMKVDKDNRSLLLAKRGSVYWQAGDKKKAFEDYEEAISTDQNNGIAYYFRGVAQRQEDKLKEALDDLNVSIKLMPDSADSYLERACVYLDMNKNEAAIADFSKALDISKDQEEAIYSWRAEAYFKSKQYDQAIADAKNALKFKNDSAERYEDILLLGKAFLAKNDIDNSSKYCTNAIELNPENDHAYIIRAIGYKRTGKLEKAVADYTKAIAIDPERADTYVLRSTIYFYLGRDDLAMRDACKAVSLDPEDEMALTGRARLFLLLGKRKEALIDYESILKIHPESEWAKQEMEDIKAGKIDDEWFRERGYNLPH